MPSRNRIKSFVVDGYYHVYNRGLNKQDIFKNSDDYAVFLNLLKRYLDDMPHEDNKGREYNWFYKRIELMAFCLMPNHFHLLLLQKDETAMTELLRAVCTSYTGYFNKKYGRVGPLFQGVYKASLITDDSYLMHVGRYIHLNPREWSSWEFSSYKYFAGSASAAWLRPGLALEMLEGQPYGEFMAESRDDFPDQANLELADI